MSKPLSVGKYLLDQLGKRGVKHIFGVPGDYVLRFYDLIEQSPLQHIGTTREETAGFAADATPDGADDWRQPTATATEARSAM